jgi:hypothetical protein
MNALEQQLAKLLAEAPGEPPTLVDPDELLSRASRRHRFLAPALAAAAVAAIAVPITVFALGDSGTPPARPAPPGTAESSPPAPAADPKADAIDRVTATLAAAPVPPGAVRSDTELKPVRNALTTSDSPNEVRRTAWWTAPGDVDAAISYLKGHAPDGMELQAWSGSSSDARQEVDFAGPARPDGYPLELDYFVAPYAGGVAVRIDSWTTWAPNRPQWSFVPDDATSVDITVVRDALNAGLGGAPTVRRTLTGGALKQLAGAVNALAPRAPEGIHSCPAVLVRAKDLAVFHTPDGDIRMLHEGGGCAFNATIAGPAGSHEVYINGSEFTDAVLTALGLPSHYGFGMH